MQEVREIEIRNKKTAAEAAVFYLDRGKMWFSLSVGKIYICKAWLFIVEALVRHVIDSPLILDLPLRQNKKYFPMSLCF